MPKHERLKAKARVKKHKPSGVFASERDIPPLEEAVNKTVSMLHSLGGQVFAVSPFSGHYDRWLTDLRVVVSEFESNPHVTVDAQFIEERSRILSFVEAKLEEGRRNEAFGEKAFRELSDDKLRLEQVEQGHAAKEKEIEDRKKAEVTRLTSNVDALRDELNRITRMKAGIFRSLSKSAKAQKEAEATQKLSSAKNELASALEKFMTEHERQRNTYEATRQSLIGEMRNRQKEVDSQEIDSSVEARETACKALAESVTKLSNRQQLPPQ